MGRAANDIASVLIPSTPDSHTLILDTSRPFGREISPLETRISGIKSTIKLDLYIYNRDVPAFSIYRDISGIYIYIYRHVFSLSNGEDSVAKLIRFSAARLFHRKYCCFFFIIIIFFFVSLASLFTYLDLIIFFLRLTCHYLANRVIILFLHITI